MSPSQTTSSGFYDIHHPSVHWQIVLTLSQFGSSTRFVKCARRLNLWWALLFVVSHVGLAIGTCFHARILHLSVGANSCSIFTSLHRSSVRASDHAPLRARLIILLFLSFDLNKLLLADRLRVSTWHHIPLLLLVFRRNWIRVLCTNSWLRRSHSDLELSPTSSRQSHSASSSDDWGRVSNSESRPLFLFYLPFFSCWKLVFVDRSDSLVNGLTRYAINTGALTRYGVPFLRIPPWKHYS